MAKKIAINGFGRIGRLTFRNLLKKDGVEVVAINDLTDNHTLAHLLKYDSAQGPFDGTVESTDDALIVNGTSISAYSERNPEALPWEELGVDLVLECTGIFVSKDKAGMHLKAGAKDVLISAPAKGGDVQTIVLGVNQDELDRRANVFSNASCTTNCLAPVVKLVDENFGIVEGSMTTIHAYTADQNIQDAPHRDLRRARAAAYNIVPTSTGAASAVKLVYPNIGNKISAIAIRVPVITGSMIELNVVIDKSTTVEEVNGVFKAAAEGAMKGILQYTEDPIVSGDIIRNTHSSIFDAGMTQVNGNMLKVVSWYDNEAGYSARLADFAHLIATK
ncbi:type I glyceraldehyde-3-phosphate dehydrogenase [Flavilitoribacter nigricans]|uniref:Glyceraldehyde-3-phosphate dehydrogenase n=1 Tax=Flavilitoribacter nigricans (strain ATCC 23147 / DSM 23189 / NBRC 102662 / NCIMB 1420 / SS-2) TaxID=1122177 RepID=A0A2D0NCF4_FLAN2|nr:type I glyceraldehyde-3-phosphate dehydrogenase [Flavilitoribacter nigricans]PHN05859.1 type I glyceraldehyde-3-phosphate dehydrogenase [Flavilitoribacter nigricans DSM 23189 = NBRC 102662]